MKYQAAIVTAASGSVGGLCFSRNHYGAYIRKRVNPVNPGSTFQTTTQGIFSALVAHWTSTLTNDQRAAWTLWADNTPQSGYQGTYYMTGQNAFIKMNAVRVLCGLSPALTAPGLFAGAVLTPPSLTLAGEGTQLLTVAFTNTDDWATAVGGFLLVYASRPQNPSVDSYKGPYRLAGTTAGAVVPPTTPKTFTAPFPIAEGQRVHCAFRCINPDARISSLVRDNVLVTA
jgi:hypothetical protein